MSEKIWNEGQRQALDTRGSNVLVSAAAGSGKTAVLTERVLSHVRDESCDLRELLVVTFSSAAAAEMKERIYDKLVGAAAAHGSRCIRQSELINDADICTIHSLCARIIRENFEQAGVSPGYYTLPAGEADLIKEEACREVFDELYEAGDTRFLGLIRRYCGRNDAAMKELLFKLHSFAMSQVDGCGWIAEKLAMQQSSEYINELEERYDGQNLLALSETIGTGIALLGMLQKRDCAYMVSVVTEDCDRLRHLQKIYEKSGREAFAEAASGMKVFGNARFKDMDPGFADFVSAVRKDMKKLYNDILDDDYLRSFQSDVSQELAHLLPDAQALLWLYGLFLERFTEQKKEKNALDFNDLEHKALAALADPQVCEKYCGKYRHIYMDEYQDTNPVQEEIIRRLSRGDNRFMVGDLKQSIYRFRQADPMIFRNKARLFQQDDTHGSLIRMNENFRSFQEIIDFVNYAMEGLMSEDLGDIQYGTGEALCCGKKLCGGGISLLLACKAEAEDENEENDDAIKELNEAEFEAHMIAREIAERLLKPVYDDRQGEYRAAEYGDFAILLREVKNTGKIFKAVLQAHGIPAFVETDAMLSDYPEVEAFIDLLKIVDNFRQDIPLLGVMRSGFGGFSPEELADIRIFKNDEQPFFEAARAYAEQKDDMLAQKLQSFLQKLNRLKCMSRGMRLTEFLLVAEKETGFGEKLSALINGEGKYASLLSLIENAGAAGQSASESLHMFIRYIDDMQRMGRLSDMVKPQGGKNTVKIISIHKSKGLEFPVVVLPRLNKRFNFNELKDDMLICRELGLALSYIDENTLTKKSTFIKEQARHNIKREALSEELRILYVGFTRAKQNLILSGSVQDLAKSMIKWHKPRTKNALLQKNCYLDWLMPLILRLNGADGIYQKACGGFMPDAWQEPSVDIRIVTGVEEPQAAAEQRRLLLEQFLQNNDAEPMAALSYRYPYEKDLFVPSKRSVTQIKKEETQSYEARPALMDDAEDFFEGTGVDAAQRGTITHYVMRHLDFEKDTDIAALLKALEGRGLLNEEESACVNTEWIQRFLQSGIAARIRASGRVLKETPFCLSIPAAEMGCEGAGESVIVQGVIDLCFLEDNAWVILDYKTDRVNDATAPETAKKYQTQLDLYERALASITGIPVKEKLVYFFRSGLYRL